MIVHANLDCEARWAGVTLPQAVARRISALGALLAAVAPGPCELWTPAPIDPARLVGIPVRALHVGTPPRADLAWAAADARAANDRRFALAVATRLGVALPGARVVTSIAELDHPLDHAGPWVGKAPWTAAGRDRHRGAGGPPVGEARAHVTKLLARFGALVVEPWCDRIADAGQCATVEPGGAVTVEPAHGLLVDARGGFVGIDRTTTGLLADELAQLARVTHAVGEALAAIAYRGRFAIDAFAYRDPATGDRRFHPLCEINARHTFGWIAHALGVARLGFSPLPPGARVLIAPTADDPVTAWGA